MNLLRLSLILFFISGFTALSYEITWTRLLRHIFGADNLAISTVLTVFIGGLALGAYIAAKKIKFLKSFKLKIFNKQNSLLSAYAVIELAIAIYACLIPFLFSESFLAPIWTTLVSPVIEIPALSFLLRFIISGLLLIVPTVLMGMTFPILSEMINEAKYASKNTAYLYAINTAGAILGTLATGFVLLPSLGLNGAIYFAALLNASIFAAAWFANRSGIKVEVDSNKTSNTTKHKIQEPIDSKSLLAVVFISGFIALSLEVIWSKLLTLILGSSVYAFTIVLATFLLGISLGSVVANKYWHKITKANSSIMVLLLSLAASIFICSSLFNQLPWLFLSLAQKIPSGNAELWWLGINLVRFVIAAVLLLPVSLISGAIFTIALNLQGNTAKDVAKVYYTNTVGAILGSFSTGFILIPLFNQFGSGMQLSSKLLILISLLVALLLFIENQDTTKIKIKEVIIGPKLASLGTALLIVFAYLLMPAWQAGAMSSGVAVYQGLVYKSISKNQFKQAISDPTLYHKEGLNNVVTVTKNSRNNTIFLKNNGKNEASVPINKNHPSKADMLTQILLGELPNILHSEEPEKALVIGMGGGTTVGSTLRYPSIKTVDVCELEASVIEAVKFFENKKNPLEGNGSPTNPTKNPLASKVKVHSTDARNYLLTQKNSYDVIISQPSDPWISGASDLFTDEFWQLSAKQLNSDGIFAQWLQLYSITPEYLAIILKTFQKSFPEVLVIRPGEAGELILLGSKTHFDLDPSRIERRINKRFTAHNQFKKLQVSPIDDLERISIHNAIDIISNIILETDGSIAYADKYSKGKINTDNNMIIEFETPKKANLYDAPLKQNLQSMLEFADSKKQAILFNTGSHLFYSKLAQKHNQLVTKDSLTSYSDNIHGKLALAFADEALAIKQSPTSLLPFVEIFNNIRKFTEAKSFIQKGIRSFSKTFPKTAFEHANLASLHAHNNDFYTALNYINQAINLEPQNAKYYEKKAMFLFELYKINKPERLGSKLRSGDIKKKDIKRLVSYVNQALNAYRMSLNYDPNNVHAWAGIANVEFVRVASFGDQKAIFRAIKAYKKAIKADTNYWPAHLNLGKLYSVVGFNSKESHSGKRFASSVKFLNNALILNPQAYEAEYHLGLAHYHNGSLDKAMRHLGKVVHFCEDPEAEAGQIAVANLCQGPGGIKAVELEFAKNIQSKLEKLQGSVLDIGQK